MQIRTRLLYRARSIGASFANVALGLMAWLGLGVALWALWYGGWARWAVLIASAILATVLMCALLLADAREKRRDD